MFADPDIEAREDCCYEHCADELCVRNASLCDGGGGDQRPVCVEDVKLPDDGPEEKCDDYSLSDPSGGGRPGPGAVGLLALVSALQLVAVAVRAALMADVT